MTSHALSFTSAHWWWPSAAAAAVAVTAVGAITVGPALFNDSATPLNLPAEQGVRIITPVRTCLSGQAHWNSALHGSPSICGQAGQARGTEPGAAGGVRYPDRELPLP